MSITLVLPPLTQLNTPYPSISYLANHLTQQGIASEQRDLGIELFLRIFSRTGLSKIFDYTEEMDAIPEPAWRTLSLRQQYADTIEATIAFLQGKDASLSHRILEMSYLPMGPRMQRAQLHAFGTMGRVDAARYLATLYLADIADFIASCVDEGFALAKYQAHLATSAHDFTPLWRKLSRTNIIDTWLDELGDTLHTEIVALSVPFPGNLYGALRLGKRLKQRGVYVVMGGGYINTELRDTKEERLWTCVDAITFDDGEGPLQAIIEHHQQGKNDWRHRTKTKHTSFPSTNEKPIQASFGANYKSLRLDWYIQTIDTLNPAHRLWADGRWNKITIAHGCYWKKCNFCDVKLDYISSYGPSPIVELVDHIGNVVQETGVRGFHFVDEAAPPKLLRSLALEILQRGLQISYWGNIRFEKHFDQDLCQLLSQSGLIAVTGGLEVANSRLLKLINKGVTVDQVTRCTHAFRCAGIMVHAYLMYGFPTQSIQETIDSMELVRQMFKEGVINSAFWHRFVLTKHAPIYDSPKLFQINIETTKKNIFAQNDVPHKDLTGGNHDLFETILPLALEQWMQGADLDRPVCSWFPFPMPSTKENPDRIRRAIDNRSQQPSRSHSRLLWLGANPLETEKEIILHCNSATCNIEGSSDQIQWLSEIIHAAMLLQFHQEPLQLQDAINCFPGNWNDFQERWQDIRDCGLLYV